MRPVVTIALDADQAQMVAEDISNGLALGGNTFLIVCDPDGHSDEREITVGENATMKGVPEPDILTGGLIFTVAMENDMEDFLQKLQDSKTGTFVPRHPENN